MDDIKSLAALAALNEMMRGSFFSICKVRDVAEMLGIKPEPASYAVLQALHCVHFDKMPRDLYARLPALIQQALSGAQTFQFELKDTHAPQVLVTLPEPKRGFFQRLLR